MLLMLLMLLIAFRRSVSLATIGLQPPLKDVWLPIKGRLVTH